jgi:ABC-type phosphate/phosphonate transport system substrate-binding protein
MLMESNSGDPPLLSLRERFLKGWFPPAAVVGGIVTLIAAALRVRPAPRAVTPAVRTPTGPPQAGGSAPSAPADVRLDREYSRVGIVGRAGSAALFRQSLLGVAVDAADQVHALGDDEIRVFGPDGSLTRHWRVADTAECLAVDPDGRVYVGGAGRVDIYESNGRRAGGFAFGEAGAPASVSAIKAFKTDVLVADASARIIRRFDASGRQLGLIGDRTRTKAFILPNGKLDFDVDAAGVVRATDTGRHQVTAWALDGTPIGKFGKFGMSDPADFVGCCNPVNLATTPDGKVVTAEKMVARVKVYEPDGRLLAVVGPEHFDQKCTQIHLAVDSKGRLLAADPVRREISVFAQVVKIGVNEPFCRETPSSCVSGTVARDYGPLATVVRERAGVDVQFTYYAVEEDLVRSVARGEVDGAIAKTWTALRACRAAGVEFERVCDVAFPDGESRLTGVFIASAEGPIHSMADVAGKRLALGRPESYENSHAVDRALRDLGVEPGPRQAAGGCIPAAVSILDGEADVAVVSSYCTRYALDQIVGKPGAFRILGETAPIPFATVALTSRVPGSLRAAIKSAWLGDAESPRERPPFPGGFRPPAAWTPEELGRA